MDNPKEDPIVEKIASLTRDQAIEAALALRDTFGGSADDSSDPFLVAVKGNEFGHTAEVDALARMLLIVAAADPDMRQDVEEVVTKVGDTAFILGGAEIVAVAALGVYLFTSVQSRGVAETIEEFEVDSEGKVVKYKDHKIFNSGSSVMKGLVGLLRRGK